MHPMLSPHSTKVDFITNTPKNCKKRKKDSLNEWSEEEDEKLRFLVLVNGITNWDEIASKLGLKSSIQCKQRWNGLRPVNNYEITERRKWTKEEDEKLTHLVHKYGARNWRIIASYLNGRLPKQCRERWINHVDPEIVKGRLTEKDWQVVLEAQQKLGNRWSEIAKLLPGRTPNQIKNHWHAMIRKRSNQKIRNSCAKYSSGEVDQSSSESDEEWRTSKRPKYECTKGLQQISQNELFNTHPSNLDVLCEMAEVLYKMEVEPALRGDKIESHTQTQTTLQRLPVTDPFMRTRNSIMPSYETE
jgi:hypothetical protein